MSENALIGRDVQLLLEEFQPRDERRQPFFFAALIELAQTVIRLVLAAWTPRQLVG